jgi:hypothetical protein
MGVPRARGAALCGLAAAAFTGEDNVGRLQLDSCTCSSLRITAFRILRALSRPMHCVNKLRIEVTADTLGGGCYYWIISPLSGNWKLSHAAQPCFLRVARSSGLCP